MTEHQHNSGSMRRVRHAAVPERSSKTDNTSPLQVEPMSRKELRADRQYRVPTVSCDETRQVSEKPLRSTSGSPQERHSTANQTNACPEAGRQASSCAAPSRRPSLRHGSETTSCSPSSGAHPASGPGLRDSELSFGRADQHKPDGFIPAGVTHPSAAHAAGGGKRGNGKRGNGKKGGGFWRMVFWGALAVFLVALLGLGALLFSYWQGQHNYDSLASEVFQPQDLEGKNIADLFIDWDKLKAMNPDTVGWIYIPDTVVNYPIVHTSDDVKYLTHDFDGRQTWGATYGCIFLAAANSPDFSDTNNIIFGHHLNNGSMFACLTDFQDQGKFDGHRTVYIFTPQGNFRLRTFSLLHVAADDPLAQTSFGSEQARTKYVQDKMKRSVVTASDVPAPSAIDHLFTFSTCDNLSNNGRIVLFAYVVDSSVADIDPASASAINDASKEIVS